MDPNLILEIIKLSLQLALQLAQDMPADQKAKLWADHAARQAFWQGLLQKMADAPGALITKVKG